MLVDRDSGEHTAQAAVKVLFTNSGLKLEIKFKAAGHADVFGTAQSQLSVVPSRTRLDFSFESDQSFLSHTVQGLRSVIQQFPVRSGV